MTISLKRFKRIPSLLAWASAFTLLSVSNAHAERQKLVVASFGGKLDEVYKQVFEPFRKAHDVDIEWVPGTAPGNVAKLAATRNSPEFDLILFDDINQGVASSQQLLAPIKDSKAIPWNALTDRAKAAGGDGAAIGAFVTGIYYRADVFKDKGWAPPTSWDDLSRQEFCGHLGLERATQVYTLNAVLMLANAQVSQIDKGIARFTELAKCARVLEPAAAKHEEKILLGELLVGVNSSIRALPLTQRIDGLKFVLPKEGAVVSTTMVSAVRNAPHPALTEDFIAWFVSPEVQDQLMRKLFYSPVNVNVDVPQQLHELGVPDQATLDRQPKIVDTDVVEHRRDWTRKLERSLSQ
ncbi:extracellular solute-binding protein [Pseudomonas typographi]|uniref:Extracellular solute-binding protein n=1 Tax=Pseudomonas typographi TaxID=2715964 RepID=A0ABR7Z2A4_9PSED|nr:extracellular solute-binding protein [Pseudomonas typographi]MBD1589835.1 extracellular solute-binding protein [Pseudomonas typographi]MBD1599484.1 extracellular solute-binding protein [Pseudomonas typographi]